MTAARRDDDLHNASHILFSASHLIAAILAVPIAKVPATNPLVAESGKHAACSEMVQNQKKSPSACCVMSFATIEADVLSLRPKSVSSKMRLSYLNVGNGADPQRLKSHLAALREHLGVAR